MIFVPLIQIYVKKKLIKSKIFTRDCVFSLRWTKISHFLRLSIWSFHKPLMSSRTAKPWVKEGNGRLNVFWYFCLGFLSQKLTIHRTAREVMGPLLFPSTTPTRLWTFRYLFAVLHLNFLLQRIFDRSICNYQTATWWHSSTCRN